MAAVTDKELFSALRSGDYSNVYWFYGHDIDSVEKCAKQLVNKIVGKDGEAYNLHSFQGENLEVGELIDSCEMLPFFAERQCCTVCDINAEQLSADDNKALLSLVADLPKETVLIFYNTSADICGGKKVPTAKNKKLLDAVSKHGTSCCFEPKTPAELSKTICSRAAKLGCSIQPQNAAYLAELYNSNMVMLSNELDKLASYANGGEITREIIDMLSADQLSSTIFDLSKAIALFDTKKALRLMDELFLQKTEPISLLYAVTSSLLDMYRARAALNAGKYIDDIVRDFAYPKNKEFLVKNAVRDVRSIPAGRLRRCVMIAAETDRIMKSSSGNQQVILQEAVVKMAAAPRN